MMYFGDDFCTFSCPLLYLNGEILDFVTKWKYLGVLVKSDKNFQCSVVKPRSAFYRSARSILNVLNKPSEDVQMKLLYSVSVPCLTYACDVYSRSRLDLR